MQRLDGIGVALAGKLCILVATSAVAAATLISPECVVQGPMPNTLLAAACGSDRRLSLQLMRCCQLQFKQFHDLNSCSNCWQHWYTHLFGAWPACTGVSTPVAVVHTWQQHSFVELLQASPSADNI